MLLFFRKVRSTQGLNVNTLVILAAAWMSCSSWYFILDQTAFAFLSSIINSLPFAAYFFFIEERKYYSIDAASISIFDYLFAISLPILATQMIIMIVARLTGSNFYQDCTLPLQIATAGMLFTVISLNISLKYFVKNNYVLEGYFEYIPDNNVANSIFSIISLIFVIVAPSVVSDMPSVMVLLKCLVLG